MRLPFLLYTLVCLFLISCANIIAPSGGDPDLEPPVPIESDPPNYSSEFNQDHIEITFDEFFQLNDEYNQFLFSPPLKYQPKIKIQKKSLHIYLQDTLLENTTYTFNFGEAISDITEGNKLENYQFVFSTGEYVDSLKIKGTTQYAQTHETKKGILVMLYKNTADSVVRTEKPYYFSRTNEKGEFQINNIKAGWYKIFALKDQNLNYRWDLPNEDIAFLGDLIEVSLDTADMDITLDIYQEDKSPQLLVKRSSRQPGKLNLRFSKPADSISLRPLDYSGYFDCITKTDTMFCWLDDLHLDSLIVEVNNNNRILDTIKFTLPALPEDSTCTSRPLKLQKTNLSRGEPLKIDLKRPFRLFLPVPARNFDATKISLFEDSTEQLVSPDIFWEDSIMRSISISYDWKQGMIYKLVFSSNCFENIYGNSNDTTVFRFRARLKSEYGNLKLSISANDSSQNYILQLLVKKKPVLEKIISQSLQSDIYFEFLKPKEYSIRVIEDKNGNGKWDGGDYDKKIQPERVYYYPEPIKLRPNWDMDIDVELPF